MVLACAEELPEPWVLGFGGKERWLLRGTDQRRAELALALADALLGAEENDLWHPLLRLIAAEWPKKVDPAPLIERVLAHPDRDDARALTLDVAANAHAETWAVRLLEARLTGDSRLDAALGDHLDALIRRCRRHVLRPLAERGLRVDSCVEWAVRALLGRCHDRERDPPRGALARAWVADPRMSEAVRKARPDLVRGWLRARLARGQASLAEAVSLLRVDDVDDEAHWVEIRRLRAEALAGPDPDALAITATLELTRWGPDEWAAVDEFMNRIPRASWFMVKLLCRLTAPEAVPRVERLLGRVSSYAQGPLLAHRRALAQLYGLELGPPPPPRDEDEDDDG